MGLELPYITEDIIISVCRVLADQSCLTPRYLSEIFGALADDYHDEAERLTEERTPESTEAGR